MSLDCQSVRERLADGELPDALDLAEHREG